MSKKSENPRSAHPEKPAPHRARARRIVRTIANGTVLAVGLAAAQFGLPDSVPDNDQRFSIFNKTLVDRLHLPITRYHE
ncbi:MAG TPA: hypothetical protein VFE25_09455 [Opitutaceae bacterium]|jgi:hypothetical protein|nr:hypothetical protein [Opitutaceae bacterium]